MRNILPLPNPGLWSPEDRAEILIALKQIKFLLWDGEGELSYMGHSEYICNCLLNFEPCEERNRRVALIEDLVRRLIGSKTVRTWVSRLLREESFSSIPKKEMQAYRHAWVDALIEVFE